MPGLHPGAAPLDWFADATAADLTDEIEEAQLNELIGYTPPAEPKRDSAVDRLILGIEPIEELPEGEPVTEAENVAMTDYAIEAAAREPVVLQVNICPTCFAVGDEPCTTPSGRDHKARREARAATPPEIPADVVELEEAAAERAGPNAVALDPNRWEMYAYAKGKADDWVKTAKELRAEIEEAMGSAENGTVEGKTVVRWFYRKTRRLNQARLKADHPEVIEAYTEPVEERRFEAVKDDPETDGEEA